jgi:hypothetical protein
VVEALVLRALDQGCQCLPAVDRVEDRVVGADHEAFVGVGEPDVEEGPARAFGRGARGFGLQGLARRRIGVRGQLAQMREHERVGAAAVELQLPAGAAVGAVQHHAFMSDRPAFARVGEGQRGQVGARPATFACRQRGARDHRK